MSLAELVNEAHFPGNTAALSGLVDCIANRASLAFAGAGVSVPLAPAWNPFLRSLIEVGVQEGFVRPEDETFLANQIYTDPLELASTLEEQFTRERFRSRMATIFDLKDNYTKTHELIAKLPLSGIVTTNYDEGLSLAVVQQRKTLPKIVRAEDRYQLNRWLHGEPLLADQVRILHWHGNVSNPDGMVITADDYDAFYRSAENKAVIEDLWRSKQLLVIGFSFQDPILSRIAETVLRNLEAENRHFAFIGYKDSSPLTELARRQFARKYRLTPIFYSIRILPDGSEDHSALTGLLEYLLDATEQNSSNKLTSSTPDTNHVRDKASTTSRIEEARRDFENGLFVTPNGSILYTQPNLRKPATLGEGEFEHSSDRLQVSDIVDSGASFQITAPAESGGTTLARRLCLDLNIAGQPTAIRDANELPNYAKKLRADAFFQQDSDNRNRCLILDNVNTKQHERLIKEIIGLDCFGRLIMICKANDSSIDSVEDSSFSISFDVIMLRYPERSDIRVIANQMYDTYDSDLISAAVGKTYDDLLDLCIPLTPSNIIMYLRVLYREGTFVPLNRLHIMDRYIRDLLTSPGDLLDDALTVDHKIDILASFVYSLHHERKTFFSKLDWEKFAAEEIKRSISSFKKDSLLSDLIGSRFIVSVGDLFHFKYKLFYAYFLGQYVSQRSEVLKSFIDNGRHVSVDGLVEIVAGLSKENTLLITDLVERLEKAVAAFDERYGMSDFDPYDGMRWVLDPEEQVQLWAPVTKQLADGPASDSHVDTVKRSLMAEQKTEDQVVIIREFSEIEQDISYCQGILTAALRESRGLDGKLKVRAMSAILSGSTIMMQVGFCFAPLIASRKYFVWNSVAFVNNLIYSEEDKQDFDRQTIAVASVMPRAIASHTANFVGSKRLGDLHVYMLRENIGSNFSRYLNFAALIRSKPDGWDEIARTTLNTTNRQALYLRYHLSSLLLQYHEEVNTNADRHTLKKLVSVVQAKRILKSDAPTQKMISKVSSALDAKDYFSSPKIDDTEEIQ